MTDMSGEFTAHVCTVRVGAARRKALENQLVNKCGFKRCAADLDATVTHVFVEDDLPFERISELFQGGPFKIMKNGFIPKRVKDSTVKLDDFLVEIPSLESAQCSNTQGQEVYTQEADNISQESEEPVAKRAKFVCEGAASKDTPITSVNANIISALKVLAEGYKSTNDKWRTLSYEKAIKCIERLNEPIESKEQVLQLRGIGDRIADKIVEIIESGTLRKADNFAHNERVQTMNLLTNIWGVGPTIADQWYAKGIRTLDDVRGKVKLSRQQEIGLKHYEDFLKRMPHNEATQIVSEVRASLNGIDASFIMDACGSYRRGKQSCGDVDILITHKDGASHEHILARLIKKLQDEEFLTDHLVECSADQNQKKYMGVCKLKAPNSQHRRIDIISVPYREYATSLIYFTGSAHFTRSIYTKAKSMGMRLNQHGLYAGVMRQASERLNQGYLIETPTEQSVFEALGLEYRTPSERDHA